MGSLLVLRPFVGPLLWATTIVVATWPIMRKVEAGLGGRRGLAVTVMTLTLLLVVFVPLYLALSAILDQTDRVAELARALPTFRLPPPPPWLHALPFGAKAEEHWLALSLLKRRTRGAARPLRRDGADLVRGAGGDLRGNAGSLPPHRNHLRDPLLEGEIAARNVRRFFRRLWATAATRW